MRILTQNDIRFEKSATGTLTCRLKDGTCYEHVHCITLFPLSLPGKFISVIRELDQEIEEIGVLDGLDGFEESQREFIHKSIEEHYFVPEISDIIKLKTKKSGRGQSLDEWQIDTNRGRKTIYLFNPR